MIRIEVREMFYEHSSPGVGTVFSMLSWCGIDSSWSASELHDLNFGGVVLHDCGPISTTGSLGWFCATTADLSCMPELGDNKGILFIMTNYDGGDEGLAGTPTYVTNQKTRVSMYVKNSKAEIEGNINMLRNAKQIFINSAFKVFKKGRTKFGDRDFIIGFIDQYSISSRIY